MTRPELYKVGGSLAVLLLGLLFGKRAAAATRGPVDVGAPTVTGSGSDAFGGQDYGTIAPTDGGLEPSPEVAAAIAASNEAIAGYEVPPNPWGIE
jgi:hypothetical protein